MVSQKFMAALCAVFLTTICYAKGAEMSDVKSYCLGRYLVDVPSDAKINGQAYEYVFERIDSASESQADFDRRMTSREGDLKAGKQKNEYKLVSVVSPSRNIRIFELSKKLLTGPAAGVEAYRWDQGYSFSMQGTGYSPAKVGGVISRFKDDILPNLHARTSDNISGEPGFCLKNGFIENNGANAQSEDAGISFKFDRWPGVLVSVRTMTVTKLGEPKLLERIAGTPVPDALKGAVGLIKTLRKGQRSVNGRDGEEILETYPTDLGFRTHQFRWEAQGTQIGEPLKPTVIVEFQSGMFKDDRGNPLRPNISDDQAIEIFDAVINSIRLRQTNGSKVSSTEPASTLPLGTLAQTGSVCPQTGWWTCPEANGQEISGGARQHFTAGMVMPVAIVLGNRNFTDRLLGKQPQYDVSTTWQLVGLGIDPT